MNQRGTASKLLVVPAPGQHLRFVMYLFPNAGLPTLNLHLPCIFFSRRPSFGRQRQSKASILGFQLFGTGASRRTPEILCVVHGQDLSGGTLARNRLKATTAKICRCKVHERSTQPVEI